MALFEEYAVRLARGERPDLRQYLERAGEGREELSRLVDVWLQIAPPPEPDAEALAVAEAWVRGEPPLAALRARRGLRREEVVDDLLRRFRIDPAKRAKVERLYHEVEAGLRVPAEARLCEALADLLRFPAAGLLALRPRPLEAAAFFRAEAPSAPPPAEREEEPDEVDLLFRSRR